MPRFASFEKPPSMKIFVHACAILFSVSCLQASDIPEVDSDLPQPLSLDFAETLVTHSPFTRSVNLEQSL